MIPSAFTRIASPVICCILFLTNGLPAEPSFADWIAGYPEVGGLNRITDDPDGDGMNNGVENYLGTDPSVPTPGIRPANYADGDLTFSHPLNPDPASDLVAYYTWSKDMHTFLPAGWTDREGTRVDISTVDDSPTLDVTSVLATISGTPTPNLFLRLEVAQSSISGVAIDTVYFAQTHVLEPGNPLFKLVSGREALIKAHIVVEGDKAAPVVTATLSLGDARSTMVLSGPPVLPASIPNGPGIVQHSYENTFTGIIPKEWVQPGLSVTVKAADAERVLENLTIGAPNKMVMNMYDLDFFISRPGNYPAGWEQEFAAKLPFSELEIRRVPDIVLPEIVVMPRGGHPALRVSSSTEYRDITGEAYTEGRTEGKEWMKALRDASGKVGNNRLHYGNVYGAGGGGLASIGGLFAAGDGTNAGVLIHEVGHTVRLPHWGQTNSYPYWRPLGYPYIGSMYGIDPRRGNDVHTGPTWAFDLPTRTFLPATVQAGSSNAGYYQKDPMQGGGLSRGDQPAGFLLNFFSDYSVWHMMDYLEKNLTQWNSDLNAYATWNAQTGAYTQVVDNYLRGVLPTLQEEEVYSILVGVSAVTPDVCIVYPPIGPYLSGTTDRFDPRESTDRLRALQSGTIPPGGYDISLKIVQGGTTKYYMLPIGWLTNQDPLTANSYTHKALNIPAQDGPITEVQLLLTPDVHVRGLPAVEEVLTTWQP